MNHKLFGRFAAALFFAVSLTASAQNHSIRISDGVVFIDGREQAPSDLPRALEVEGVDASLSFSGMTRFRIADITYLIRDGLLLEAVPTNDDVVVFLGLHTNSSLFPGAGNRKALWLTKPRPRALNTYYELLDNQVNVLNEARVAFDQEQSLQLVTRIRQSAENAAVMVRAFPQVELHAYMESIQDRDAGLYDDILKEQLMEMETHRLASRLLATRDDDRRTELREELHANLQEIFELKQVNRRAEVEQLALRLRELRTQMDGREENRNEIILRRIRQLLNELD